jgi:hypothetical protein
MFLKWVYVTVSACPHTARISNRIYDVECDRWPPPPSSLQTRRYQRKYVYIIFWAHVTVRDLYLQRILPELRGGFNCKGTIIRVSFYFNQNTNFRYFLSENPRYLHYLTTYKWHSCNLPCSCNYWAAIVYCSEYYTLVFSSISPYLCIDAW